MKKILLLSTILAGSLFCSTPTFSGIELKQINGSTGFSQIEAGEAIQIKLNNINEGGKTDTKRKVFASLNGIKGQGLFGVMTKDSYLWQAPKIAGTYKIGAFVENTDGASNIVSQDIIVKTPYLAISGRNNCPVNFVFVPNSQGLHGEANGWCIMKYEASPYSTYSGILENNGNTVSYISAKAGSESSTSKPKNPIYYNGSLENAKERCSSIKDTNGKLYTNGSLISIDVWTKLVKDLYNTNYNWTEGSVTGGNLFIGHTDNNPSYPIMSSDLDTDIYYLTNNNSSETSLISKSQARVMKTSYGDIIWDIVGNTKEFFRENYDNNVLNESFVSSFVNINRNYVVSVSGISIINLTSSYSYKDNLNLVNYEKLSPLNILGFKPNNIADVYFAILGSTTTTTFTTLMGYYSNPFPSLFNKNKRFFLLNNTMAVGTYTLDTADYTSNKPLSELGYGLQNGIITGNLSYGSALGTPIIYGGGFSGHSIPTLYEYGKRTGLLSNTGLFATTTFPSEGSSVAITNNTTSVNAGFRCMIPATN